MDLIIDADGGAGSGCRLGRMCSAASTSSSLSTRSRAELRKIRSLRVRAAPCPFRCSVVQQKLPMALLLGASTEGDFGCGRMNPHAAAPLSKSLG